MGKRVLIVGAGGREHALTWKLKQSPLVDEIYCAPGNAGMAGLADCIAVDPSEIVDLADFAEKLNVDLTVVGPELPLMLGLGDELNKRGLPVFGPTRAAAELEGSKVFAKDFLRKHEIPTARYSTVDSVNQAEEILGSGSFQYPVVIKADGLAGGKGVSIVESRERALEQVRALIDDKALGVAGSKIVIEEFLEGDEVSFFVLTDGQRVLPLVAAQDHKRALDNDEGPNTGGMGCLCPATMMNAQTLKRILREIVDPTVSGLAEEGRTYQGILYCGLMVTPDGPKVLEFNVRFGDPEAQAIIPRLKSDLFPFLHEVASGKLSQNRPEWRREPAVTVVMASGGYPGPYETGIPIEGLGDGRVEQADEVYVFQGGVAREGDQWLTSGGRVVAVTALGQNLQQAISRSYETVEKISFEGRHFRTDIGQKAVARLAGEG